MNQLLLRRTPRELNQSLFLLLLLPLSFRDWSLCPPLPANIVQQRATNHEHRTNGMFVPDFVSENHD